MGERLYYDEFHVVVGKDYIVCGPDRFPMVSQVKFWDMDGSSSMDIICDQNQYIQTICWGPKRMPTITGLNDGGIICDGSDIIICPGTPIVCHRGNAFSEDPNFVDDEDAPIVFGEYMYPVMCSNPWETGTT